ncbi:MAG: hypothetical protein ACTSX9_04820 [Candidatus Njordarchaeales archaeon]
MKIGIMSTWNDACGIALHAELLSNAFLKLGHKVVIFAAKDERVKGRIPLDKEDEDFVYRNWEMYRYGWRIGDDNALDLYFDPKPMLEEDFDALLIEKPTTTPLGKLLSIMNELKKKGPIIAVMHEGEPIINVNFMRMDFDAYTIFDERFLRVLGNVLPKEKTFIIPYPCHPIKEGDKSKAREKVNLPSTSQIAFAYGLRLKNIGDILPVLEELARKYDFFLLTMGKESENVQAAKELAKKYGWVLFRYGAPPTEELYDYLHASDAILLHRPAPNYVAVSSAVHQVLGALRPVLCPDNGFFEMLHREVLKYRTSEELRQLLIKVFEKDPIIQETLRYARKYVEENSVLNIAKKYLRLIRELT